MLEVSLLEFKNTAFLRKSTAVDARRHRPARAGADHPMLPGRGPGGWRSWMDAGSIRPQPSISGGTMATIEKCSAPGVFDPPGYSQAMKVTGAQTILFLAGQVAYDKDGGVAHRGDFTAQARQVFGAVRALVEAAGGTLGNVVKINTYVTDVRYRPEFRVIREEFFGARGPASTMIEVGALAHPDYMIEVEAIAVI
jgi:enamine deaminase RidA (YjgF/YER057c/UK114 family)